MGEQTVKLCETSSLTTGNRTVKDSLCGSVRPRADAAARPVDTNSAGMRSQTMLRKVQPPKRRGQS